MVSEERRRLVQRRHHVARNVGYGDKPLRIQVLWQERFRNGGMDQRLFRHLQQQDRPTTHDLHLSRLVEDLHRQQQCIQPDLPIGLGCMEQLATIIATRWLASLFILAECRHVQIWRRL